MISEKTIRKILAVVIIAVACLAFAVSGATWSLLLIPLIYLNGWLHGNLDEMDEHIQTLIEYRDFTKMVADWTRRLE